MIYQQFKNIVVQYGENVALVAGDDSVTYSQVDAKVSCLAGELHALGIKQGDAIASLIPNSIEFFVATLACFKLGAVLVPLNANYTDSEVAEYLAKSEAKLVIGSAEKQQQRVASVTSGNVIFVDSDNLPTQIKPSPDVAIDAEMPALFMFSSGSTGGSKQVMRTYSALLAEWRSEVGTFGVSPADTILCTVPLHHTHGFGNCLLAGILSGAKLVITLGEFNPRRVIKALENYQVTIYPSATFMVKTLSMMRLKQQPDLSHLKIIYTAGAPLDAEVIDAFTDTFAISPMQLYGSTEVGAAAVNRGDAPHNSVGKPLANVEIVIVDEADNLVQTGQEGEIVVISPSAAKVYVGMPEQTAKTFKNGRYYTGDIGRFDEQGNLYVTGRKKKMINVAGLKVDPAEVEAVILAMDKVKEVVVLGKPDGDYGEKVKAVIVTTEPVNENEIITYCKSHLAEYKWPKLIEFRDEIPKSPLGKILRKYL